MDILKAKKLPFGFSTCYHRQNTDVIGSEAYFDAMIEKGCKFGWFFTYMLWLGTTVYPEVYGDIDLRAEVTDFYQNVAGIQVDDALWDKILSGRDIRQGGKNSGK